MISNLNEKEKKALKGKCQRMRASWELHFFLELAVES